MNLVSKTFNKKALALAIIYLIVTIYTDRFIFTGSPNNRIFDYYTCKSILFFLLYFIWNFILNFRKKNIWNRSINYILFSIPFFLLLGYNGFALLDHPDIVSIYKHAKEFNPNPGTFTYIQGYLYIVLYMLMPTKYTIILFELILYIYVLGYTLERFRKIIPNSFYAAIYLFISIPIILTKFPIFPHRLPIYTPVMIYLLTVLFFDYVEKKSASNVKLIILSLIASILCHWRVEGFYFLIFFPILVYFTYPEIRGDKYRKFLFKFLFILFLIGVPQYYYTLTANPDYLSHRSTPIYTWTITTMFLNGLDEEKNKEDLSIINAFMSLNKVKQMNAELGEKSYRDEFIRFEKYKGVNETADNNIIQKFISSSKRIIINNPVCFLKSRINAFKFLANPENYAFWDYKPLNKYLMHLYIPLFFSILALLYSLLKKKWLYFFLIGCTLVHSLINFLLLPAGYYKYFYISYFAGWQIFFLALVFFINFLRLKVEKQLTI